MTKKNSFRYFENRDCQYFPCHNMEERGDFNCLFCYCPLYSFTNCPGNFYYKEINGKQVKVCSDCVFPHKPENYDIIMNFLKK